MKGRFIILAILFALSGKAQKVGIGTTSPNDSAILDVDVSSLAATAKKGFLLPRVNLTGKNDQSTINLAATNLMVYNKTAAGTGTNLIKANSIALWDSSQNIWQKFSSLAEVKALKIPIEFVLRSYTQQNLTASDLTTINTSSTPSSEVVVTWSASDVYIANANDIAPISNGNALQILTTSYYQISGMVNFRVNVDTALPAGSTSYLVVSLQKSTSTSGPWTDVASSALPYELWAAGRVQTVNFPTMIKSFTSGDILRLVISKPSFANGWQSGGVLVLNAGTDISKSFRMLRIQQ